MIENVFGLILNVSQFEQSCLLTLNEMDSESQLAVSSIINKAPSSDFRNIEITSNFNRTMASSSPTEQLPQRNQITLGGAP